MSFYKSKISNLTRINFLFSIIDDIPNGSSFLKVNSDCDLICSFPNAKFKAEVIKRDTRNDNGVLFWNIGHHHFYGLREQNRDIFGKDSVKLLSVIQEISEFNKKKKKHKSEKEIAIEEFKQYLIENVNPEYLPEGFENDIRQNHEISNLFTFSIYTPKFQLTIQYNSLTKNVINYEIVNRDYDKQVEISLIESEMKLKVRELENQIQQLKSEYNKKMIAATNLFKK
jgi:hypothetical protein